MTYRSIDRRRFTYLLSLGTDETELRKFFSDCRIQLIRRGGKVQNLPHGDKARIRVLVYELPASTDEIVRKWFSEHLTMADPESPEAVVETFKLHEEMDEEVEEETARRLARSCLVHLFKDDTPPVLLEFLRTPIGGQERDEEQAQEALLAPKSLDANEFAHVLVDLVQGHDLDKHLDDLPPDMAAVGAVLQEAMQGHNKEARELLAPLPAGSPARTTLEQYLNQQEARYLKEPPRGLAPLEPQVFNGTFDHESDEILGYCTKSDPPKAVFVHPIAVVRMGTVQVLTGEVRRRLFPETGDVMSFAGPGNPRQPRRGEVGVWRVAEHQTDKATHFHIIGDLRKVYEVLTVPFPSTDYDSVREFIKECAERTEGKLLQPTLFVLRDGLIVGPRTDRPDLQKDEIYELGLLSWNSLPCLRSEGRLFVLGPLPKEQGIYECASIAISVRKLLRPHIGPRSSPVGLTRAQLSELAQSLESNESDLNATRLQRVRAELERMGQNREALEAVVNELLAHPTVKERIAELVQEEANKQTAEKSQIQTEISRLQKERGEWEERIRKQRDEHRKLREETGNVVRAAFEKARTDSVGTLAELAVFQELTGSNTRQQRDDTTLDSMSPFQPVVRELTKADSNPISVLRSLGVGNQHANAFALAGELAFSVGMIMCVRGIAARLAVERWAQCIGRGVLIDSTVGLVDDSPLRNALSRAMRPEVIAILDANLSALDIYARPIADAVIDKLSKGQDDRLPAVLISICDGVGSLPVPKVFERLSITIDMDARHEFGRSDLMERAFDPEDGFLQARLWGPMANRLRDSLKRLDGEKQALVLAVLSTK